MVFNPNPNLEIEFRIREFKDSSYQIRKPGLQFELQFPKIGIQAIHTKSGIQIHICYQRPFPVHET